MSANAQTLVYLNALFGEESDGFIELRLIDPTDREDIRRGFYETVEDALTAIDKVTGRNVHVGVAKRAREGGKKEDMLSSNAVWVDIDFYTKDQAIAAAEALKTFPHPPSAAVRSGGGWHLYWFLDEPLDLTDEENRTRLENVNWGLLSALDGDPNAFDCGRILRPPGTMNIPDALKRQRGRVEVRTELAYCETDRVYPFDTFEAFESRGEVRARSKVDAVAYARQDYTGEVPKSVRKLLEKVGISGLPVHGELVKRWNGDTTGLKVPAGNAGQSELDMSVADHLALLDIPAADIENALRAFRSQRAEASEAPENTKYPGYYARTIAEAFAWVKREHGKEPSKAGITQRAAPTPPPTQETPAPQSETPASPPVDGAPLEASGAAVHDIAEKRREQEQQGGFAGGSEDDDFAAFPLVQLGSVEPHLGSPYVAKGLLDQGTLGVIYGNSGVTKSFVALDLALAVASGQEWRGHRTRKGRVVYIAAEGARGMNNRTFAATRHRALGELDSIEFYLMPAVVRLREENNDVERFVRTVKEGAGDEVSLVVIDTLSQAMAGTDENTVKDMMAAIACAQRIMSELRCTVLIVHHSGKNASLGARGSSSLRAATNTEIEVTEQGGGLYRVQATKQRDIEVGGEWFHRLETFELGLDPDGDTVTTAVVKAVDEKEAAEIITASGGGSAKGRKMVNEVVQVCLDLEAKHASKAVPRDVLKDSGYLYKTGINGVDGTQSVTGYSLREVRNLLTERFEDPEGRYAALRESYADDVAFSEEREKLRKKLWGRANRRIEKGIQDGVLMSHSGWIWRVDPATNA